jgi:hypothetical protein
VAKVLSGAPNGEARLNRLVSADRGTSSQSGFGSSG